MERRLVLRKPLASAEPFVVKFICFTTSSALRSCIQYFNKSVGLNVERELPVNLRLTTWFRYKHSNVSCNGYRSHMCSHLITRGKLVGSILQTKPRMANDKELRCSHPDKSLTASYLVRRQQMCVVCPFLTREFPTKMLIIYDGNVVLSHQ